MKLRCPTGGLCTYVTEEVVPQTALASLAMHERATHPATCDGGESIKVKKPERFPHPEMNFTQDGYSTKMNTPLREQH